MTVNGERDSSSLIPVAAVLEDLLLQEASARDRDADYWRHVFEHVLAPLLRLRRSQSLSKLTRLAISAVAVGARSTGIFDELFTLLLDWRSSGGPYWVIQQELLRHYFLDQIHSCMAPTRVETDRALRRVQSRLNAVLPEKNEFIQHPVLQMKLHVLRGELTVLVESILSQATVEAKVDTLTSYEMNTPLDAFVEFFLGWAQSHLQATLEHADWPLFGKSRVSMASASRRKSLTPSRQAAADAVQAVAARKSPTPVKTSPSAVKKSPTPVKKSPTPVKKSPTPVKKSPTPVKAQPAPAPTRAKRARASKDVTPSSAAARRPTRASQRTRTARHAVEASESEYDDGDATEEQDAAYDDSEAETRPRRARAGSRTSKRKAALPAVEESDEDEEEEEVEEEQDEDEDEEETVQRAKLAKVQKQRQQPTRQQPKRKPQQQQQKQKQEPKLKPQPKKQQRKRKAPQREESSDSSEDDEQYTTPDEHDSSEVEREGEESEHEEASSQPSSEEREGEDEYAALYELIENSGATSARGKNGPAWTAEDVLQLCEACLKVLDEDQWREQKPVLPSAFQAVTQELKARGINRTARSVKMKCTQHVFGILQEWAGPQDSASAARDEEAAAPASSPRSQKSPARTPVLPGSTPTKKRRLSGGRMSEPRAMNGKALSPIARRSPANGFATQDFATQELNSQEFVTQEGDAPVTPAKEAPTENAEVITTPAASTSFFAALTDSVKKWFTPSKSKEADQPRPSDDQTDSSPENYAFEHRIA